jgi:hypothetical protein
VIARLLDQLGYVVADVALPHKRQAPQACIWGPNVFVRRPDRDDPAKHQVKCYVIVSSYVIVDTAPQGYWHDQDLRDPAAPSSPTGPTAA